MSRLAGAFVSPVDRRDEPSPGIVVPKAVAVLGRAGETRALGAAVALSLVPAPSLAVLAVQDRGTNAVIRAPATPAARKLGERLGRRGHAVVASGRLVVVGLGGPAETAGPAGAVAEAARVAAAAGDVPIVVAFAGARDARLDDLLRANDRVLVATGADDAALRELVLRSLALAGIAARPLDLTLSAAARALALSGTAVPPSVRQRVIEATAR